MTEPMETEKALTLGANHVVGRFRYELASQVWWWSDETYRIHGFEPGDVIPTTSLILAHKDPRDRLRVSQVLQNAAVTGEPFSSVHRIMDAHGKQRTLTVVGQGIRAPATQLVCELQGFFIDITAGIEIQASEAASASIRSSAATRAPIEQAKGIIALALHIDPEAAFERLRGTSNHTNVSVRELAGHIITLASADDGSAADIEDVLTS